MKRSGLFLLGALVTLAIPWAHGQAPQGYDAFSLVRTRNIFDPNRRPARNEPPPEARPPSGTRSRPSSFTLTGTMVAEGRALAFFSGSRSEYSKVIPVGETVAGYKVVTISPNQAELEREGKRVMLAVGHRFQIEGVTDEASGPETAGPDAPPPAVPGPNAAATPAPAATNDKAEILRRMMERRQKEMSK